MRTHLCGELDRSSIDADVRLCGWVQRRRDHGGVIFVDLRDRTGRVQVVLDPDRPEQFRVAESLRNEYVLSIEGRVRLRPEGTENPDMSTGEIEVLGHEIEVLNPSDPLPFQLEEDDITEAVRLRYRYLDLRSERMQSNLRLRHRVVSAFRSYLEARDFVALETPILTRSTPEGARDYLVPSRVYHGCFFALPQSPQIFKQLLMVSGFERYYQIARCFRDEDLRADRQPEFTQLDIEASFVDEDEVMDTTEGMVRALFHQVLDVELPDQVVLELKAGHTFFWNGKIIHASQARKDRERLTLTGAYWKYDPSEKPQKVNGKITIIADASLWKGTLRIYEVTDIAIVIS